MNPPLFFTPIEKKLIWGCEEWTISAHSNGEAVVRGGQYAGLSLSQLWNEHPELFGEASADEAVFPLLIKIITANDDLSIQVHPNDEYAAKNENGSKGKTECWYILDCDQDAYLVLGHNAKDSAELRKMIEANRFEELIRKVYIRPGDFIQINPGTVHAITGGIRLLEIQQSSDITYRLYDYGRLENGKPRPLHLTASMDVITCPAAADSVLPRREVAPNVPCQLISCEYYTVWLLEAAGEACIDMEYPFLIVCVIGGEGRIDDYSVKEGDHFILPNGYGKARISGDMKVILATTPV